MPPPNTAIHGPHGRIAVDSSRARRCATILDRLWESYRQRVSYVQIYEQVIAAAGATFVNDHIAFRTLACQRPLTGIAGVSRIFEALGYRPAGVYQFEDKHLNAIHFQHPHSEFPKLFVSELKIWELSSASRILLERAVASHREPLDASLLAELTVEGPPADPAGPLVDAVVDWIERLPWEIPDYADIVAVNHESQYAAWVLAHGYRVNHFTSLINSHGQASLEDIEKTIAALRQAGVPMKDEIEGERGSKLRQTATAAVMTEVDVRESGVPTRRPWSYAYFELAERGLVIDPATGKAARFEGFLGPQATNLFEMTRLKDAAPTPPPA